MTTCFLALGSNLHHPKRQLHTAMQHIQNMPYTYLKAVAPIYQSIPQGVSPTSQPAYYNTVAKIETKLCPNDLLEYCQQIEKKQKRIRSGRSSARTIDIDILLYGMQAIHAPNLIVPHPRLHQRDFVMVPLLDIWPEAKLPDGSEVSEHLKQLQVFYIRSRA